MNIHIITVHYCSIYANIYVYIQYIFTRHMYPGLHGEQSCAPPVLYVPTGHSTGSTALFEHE